MGEMKFYLKGIEIKRFAFKKKKINLRQTSNLNIKAKIFKVSEENGRSS